MKIFELRLLKDMVNSITKNFQDVDSIILTITYSDGVTDTYNIGGDKAGTRTTNKNTTQSDEDGMC